MMSNDIIEVRQLPIIAEKLLEIKSEIESKVNYATALECTDATVKNIKAIRSKLNKDFEELETRRKYVKSSIMEPYNNFEKIYKSCISDIYKNADAVLKEKINNVEQKSKDGIYESAKEFTSEYTASKNISFLNFDMLDIDINLSQSNKKLIEKIKNKIDQISSDVCVIRELPYAAEIMYEYKNLLNMTKAISVVTSRRNAIDNTNNNLDSQEEQSEYLQAPDELSEDEENDILHEIKLTVMGSKKKLKGLKYYMESEKITYEQQ